MLDRAGLVDAGRSAYAASDWSTALERLAAARAAGEGDIDIDDIARMARAAWLLIRIPESIALAEEVFRGYCDLDRHADAAMTALELSLRWLIKGDMTVGTAWLNRARRLLADLPEGPANAYLLYLEASVEMMNGRDMWAGGHIAQLSDLARRYPEPAIVSLSMVVRGVAELRSGDTAHAFALLDEAMLPVLAGGISAEWAGDIYCTIIHVCHELADFRRMEDWTRATETWCSQFGSDAIYTGICRVHRLELRSVRGDWSDAEALLAHESGRLVAGNPWVAGEGFYQLGEIRRLRGDAGGAREAFELARSSGIDPQPGEALLALSEGDTLGARTTIEQSLDYRDPMARVRLLRAGVEIALASGDRSGAGAYAAELRAAATRYGSPGFHAWLAHAEGMLAVADRDPAGALDALRRAESAFVTDRQPYEVARVLLLTAEAHALAGDEHAATAARTRGHGILDRLRAPVGQPASPEPVVTGPLTAREGEVLALVAEGAANREVAARLFISEKTVGRHLANVYLKIGVGSRTAAAAWWHAQRADRAAR
ncbi:LuxR C-terminal-related transcriptional regulator [Microbacterium sp. HD4P20]|uniref:helix-turn-helix domain-containing protein n=1 Tax=Microbacterium sp. HD4P20 TaxID=2864874 RepID=UPI001C6407BB|nr:helix-turn-helix transcriptional regulator [Microbacterium sp. HD4P20]MCP2635984.1 LuxR C-terminal-related transcriptional regulator [Microbacterium sp. HD4P20]